MVRIILSLVNFRKKHFSNARIALILHTAAYKQLVYQFPNFRWIVESTIDGPFSMDVEFLDLKIGHGANQRSIWPIDETIQSISAQNTLRCFSRILSESLHADVTIYTASGTLRAHKAILGGSSPVFQSMFHRNLIEKESSEVRMDDIAYDIEELKDACEESLMEDIKPDNILERLEEAWLYQLSKLKK
ncbi:Voltage dependent potassium channel [Parasponia andersonii]|uniref:Voltage dependent potassium channel n=1 Tax=Parasponia andersonii TaxID=3476 RepID=A0A2P5AKD0_PARAD|nr:Voltage dependent potassium channel [Parasponia andersonii]